MKRLLSMLLAVALVLTMTVPVVAAEENAGVSIKKVDNSKVSGSLTEKETVDVSEAEPAYKDYETVRVSIFLEKKSTIEAGFDPVNIAANDAAMSYRAGLKKDQDAMVQKIEAVLNNKLDVVWNLTLAANVISANIKYGNIAAVEAIPGVAKVVVETEHTPDVVSTGGDDPNMGTSGKQTGSSVAWNAGYTGAGSKIAIIDTGLDLQHEAFDGAALEYSLAQQDGQYDLLTAQNIEAVLDQLHVSSSFDADELFVNTKVPFAYSYIDGDTDVSHAASNSEHGSHVAGISAANAYVKVGDEFKAAMDATCVQGVAPDAQLLVMQVFGNRGGAYESDYMVAIEDAIILGADSINLSLGSANPGFTYNEDYQDLLNSLTDCGVVVVISAGNAGTWTDYSDNDIPYLYLDDVSLHTGGSPGTYTNSLGVASVENDGTVTTLFEVSGHKISITETKYSNEPLSTLAGEQEFVFIDGVGTEDDWGALGNAIVGKVAFCSRGVTSFYEKAEAAVEAGAIAVVVYNNQDGIINMDLTDYSYTAPVISITQADGALIKSLAAEQDGYWTGTMTIDDGPTGVQYDSDYYTMSSFSSWGVPGSLIMKPEITAPGGSIYSVAGYVPGNAATGHNSYELMSGTSMAAPQVAGMVAVLTQYFRESGIDLDARMLAQSLLMSTAVPMVDADGEYYSVLQQGAGLANVGNAVLADSYILMGEDATASYADGKVKAELGDDPARTGVYTFSFTVNNMTGEEKTYALDADVFTQSAFNYNNELYLDTVTAAMEATVTWSVANGVVTVPANGSAEVEVTITLSDKEKEFLDAYYTSGAYVEAYIFVNGEASEEGVAGTCHSIPVLGFYGSWTDGSMFDKGSFQEYNYGLENRVPYTNETTYKKGKYNSVTIVYSDDPTAAYHAGGNPVIGDATYMPERNAISAANGDMIYSVMFNPIRNAGQVVPFVRNANTGEYLVKEELGSLIAGFYHVNNGAWYNTYQSINMGYTPGDVEEGSALEIGVTLVPEYYIDSEGNYDLDLLSAGATFSMPFVVDNTAPTVTGNGLVLSEDGTELTVTAADNQYVAAVVLWDEQGTNPWAVVGSNADAEAGETTDFVLDVSEAAGTLFYLQVYDYAYNVSTYEVEMEIGELVDTVDSVTVDPDSLQMQKGTIAALTADVQPLNASDRSVTWTSSDESVAIVTADGVVKAVGEGNAVITATSVLDETKTATCAVEVIDINVDLNAIVWDEEGSIWYSEFNSASLPDYTKLGADLLDTDYIASATLGPNGVIYACSFNNSNGTGAIYTIDPDTNAATKLSDCIIQGTHIFYSDLTYAPAMFGTGALLGTYGPYVMAIDPVTGETLAIIDEFTEGGELVGITTCYGEYDEETGAYQDVVYLIQNSGRVIQEVYYGYGGAVVPYMEYFYGVRAYFNSGVSVGTAWYFNSAYYDGEYLYWSAFNHKTDNVVTLYAIDADFSEAVYNLGQFSEGVWPVGGLHQKDFAPYLPEIEETGLLGDANGDGTVNAVDAMLVLQYYTGANDGSELKLDLCDVDGNGAVNSLDAMYILQYYTGAIDKFPVEN